MRIFRHLQVQALAVGALVVALGTPSAMAKSSLADSQQARHSRSAGRSASFVATSRARRASRGGLGAKGLSASSQIVGDVAVVCRVRRAVPRTSSRSAVSERCRPVSRRLRAHSRLARELEAPSVPSATSDSGALPGFSDISCVKGTSPLQCTAVDDLGYEVTYAQPFSTPTNLVTWNPQQFSPVDIDGNTPLVSVACPTATQCVAVDAVGDEVSFNPHTSTATAPFPVDPNGGGIAGLACASSSQCVVVDQDGTEITFSPGLTGTGAASTPAVVISSLIDPNGAAWQVSLVH